MKKNVSDLFLLVLLLTFSASSFVLTSCSKEDSVGSAEDAGRYPYFSFSAQASGDLLKIADVTVFYTDNQGEEQRETLESGKLWKKTYTGKEFPYTAGYRLVFTMKEQELTQSSYEIGMKTRLIHAIVDKEGKAISNYNAVNSDESATLPKENVRKYIDLLNRLANYKYTMNAQGEVVSAMKRDNR